MSREIAMDWDSLAGLLDIPHDKREEIRANYVKYPDVASKAEEILKIFNHSDSFSRGVFVKSLEEVGRNDLKYKLLTEMNEVFDA